MMLVYIFLTVVGLVSAEVNLEYAVLTGQTCTVSTCKDCMTLSFCNAGSEFVTTCGTGQVCGVAGTFASCFSPDAAQAEPCACREQTGKIPDPFDKTKYSLCLPGGNQVSASCEVDTEYNPDTHTCVVPPTTPAPPEITCEDSGYFALDDECKSWYACYPGTGGGMQNTVIYDCPDGSLIDEMSGRCMPESHFLPPVFQCPAGLSGVHADPVECNAFHLCVDGQKLGATLCCDGNTKFDSANSSCTDSVDIACPQISSCTNMTGYQVQCEVIETTTLPATTTTTS